MVAKVYDIIIVEIAMEENILKLRDGHDLFYRAWKIENPKATLHINHGMAEHSARYDEFALYMNKEGYSVYCQDHRGHGYTIRDGEEGWFAEKDGWMTICDDSFELDKLIEKENPDISHLIFGHSMGSFVTRTNIALHSESYSAAVICGTGGDQGLIGKVGKKLAQIKAKRHGSRTKAPSLDRLTFGTYNKRFEKEGAMGWLSSDRKEVQKYLDDPFCGFVCSNQFYADLIEGSFTANDYKLIRQIRKDLPILFVSGALDPVGGYSKGVEKAVSLYRKAGIKDVRLEFYKEGRHEILNDTMRADVMDDIAGFYKEVLSGKDQV